MGVRRLTGLTHGF